MARIHAHHQLLVAGILLAFLIGSLLFTGGQVLDSPEEAGNAETKAIPVPTVTMLGVQPGRTGKVRVWTDRLALCCERNQASTDWMP